MFFVFFCFKQKTAYEMRISDWSSDVCSSDLQHVGDHPEHIFAKLGIFRLVALVLVEEVTWRVLRRYDDRGRLDRALVGVAQRDLALGVGLEERRDRKSVV